MSEVLTPPEQEEFTIDFASEQTAPLDALERRVEALKSALEEEQRANHGGEISVREDAISNLLAIYSYSIELLKKPESEVSTEEKHSIRAKLPGAKEQFYKIIDNRI